MASNSDSGYQANSGSVPPPPPPPAGDVYAAYPPPAYVNDAPEAPEAVAFDAQNYLQAPPPVPGTAYDYPAPTAAPVDLAPPVEYAAYVAPTDAAPQGYAQPGDPAVSPYAYSTDAPPSPYLDPNSWQQQPVADYGQYAQQQPAYDPNQQPVYDAAAYAQNPAPYAHDPNQQYAQPAYGQPGYEQTQQPAYDPAAYGYAQVEAPAAGVTDAFAIPAPETYVTPPAYPAPEAYAPPVADVTPVVDAVPFEAVVPSPEPVDVHTIPPVPAPSTEVWAASAPTSEEPLEPWDDGSDVTIIAKRRKDRWVVLAGSQRYALESDAVVLGRARAAGRTVIEEGRLNVLDPTQTMSKTHASIRLEGGQWRITDLDSTNGTIVIDAEGNEVALEPNVETVIVEKILLGDLEVSIVKEESE